MQRLTPSRWSGTLLVLALAAASTTAHAEDAALVDDGADDETADDVWEAPGDEAGIERELDDPSLAAAERAQPAPAVPATGLDAIQLGGYLRPELLLQVRPDAAPRDEMAYGIGSSRAGIVVAGEPLPSFAVDLHLILGARTDDVVNAVDAVDHDGDGTPDDVDTESSLGASVAVESALVTWRPTEQIGLTVGRTTIPLSAAAATPSNRTLFPAPVDLHDAFSWGPDLGVFATGALADERLVATAGVWNGSGREAIHVDAGGRGLASSARIELAPLGAMPFEEGDVDRGPLRVALGAGAIYRSVQRYDAAGFDGARARDLRAAASLRLSIRGLSVQAEVLRRQITDDLTARPDVGTGAYAQASYYAVLGDLGVAPMLRASVLRTRQFVAPTTGTSREAGVAVFPRAGDGGPGALRISVLYAGTTDAVTAEVTHRAVAQLMLHW